MSHEAPRSVVVVVDISSPAAVATTDPLFVSQLLVTMHSLFLGVRGGGSAAGSGAFARPFAVLVAGPRGAEFAFSAAAQPQYAHQFDVVRTAVLDALGAAAADPQEHGTTAENGDGGRSSRDPATASLLKALFFINKCCPRAASGSGGEGLVRRVVATSSSAVVVLCPGPPLDGAQRQGNETRLPHSAVNDGGVDTTLVVAHALVGACRDAGVVVHTFGPARNDANLVGATAPGWRFFSAATGGLACSSSSEGIRRASDVLQWSVGASMPTSNFAVVAPDVGSDVFGVDETAIEAGCPLGRVCPSCMQLLQPQDQRCRHCCG